MNDSERLAIAQALYNHLGELVSTKDPDSLRAQADREYKALFEQTGAKSFDVRVNGSKVGTYSVKVSKAKPAEERKELVITDYVFLGDDVSEMPAKVLLRYAMDTRADFAQWYLDHTGAVMEGCTIETIETPATEPAYMGGTLKVNAQDVADAVRGLNIGIVGLLEGEQ